MDKMLAETLEQQLEAIVDKSSLVAVISGLVDICYGKAEHLRSNWQDGQSARQWDLDGDLLYGTLGKLGLDARSLR